MTCTLYTNTRAYALLSQLLEVDWAKQPVPPSLIHLEQHVLALRELDASPLLDWKAFERVCADCGVAEDDVDVAAAHLRDAGAALSFSGAAEKRVVLSPLWLAGVLSRPLDPSRARRGMYPRSVLIEVCILSIYLFCLFLLGASIHQHNLRRGPTPQVCTLHSSSR